MKDINARSIINWGRNLKRKARRESQGCPLPMPTLLWLRLAGGIPPCWLPPYPTTSKPLLWKHWLCKQIGCNSRVLKSMLIAATGTQGNRLYLFLSYSCILCLRVFHNKPIVDAVWPPTSAVVPVDRCTDVTFFLIWQRSVKPDAPASMWKELDYRLDVWKVTNSSHIKVYLTPKTVKLTFSLYYNHANKKFHLILHEKFTKLGMSFCKL